MEILVSVIIPVYNTEKYIKKCLKSVTKQKLKNIEIIIVNDASTDRSLEIIKFLMKTDSRIKLINKNVNEGLELARRSGIKFATGKYILHVDSDDWLIPKSLSKMFNKAECYQLDILVANSVRVLDKFGLLTKKSYSIVNSGHIISHVEFMEKYYINFFGVNQYPVSMWAKLYRTEFLRRFEPELLGCNLGEDLNYNIQLFPKAGKIMLVNDYVYYYRYGGMTSKYNPTIIAAALKMYQLKKSLIEYYGTPQFMKYINIELKNYLKTFIWSLINYKKNQNKTDHLRDLTNMLNSDEYNDLVTYFRAEIKDSDDFTIAFKNRDVDRMYQIVLNESNKNAFRYNITKLISKVLN